MNAPYHDFSQSWMFPNITSPYHDFPNHDCSLQWMFPAMSNPCSLPILHFQLWLWMIYDHCYYHCCTLLITACMTALTMTAHYFDCSLWYQFPSVTSLLWLLQPWLLLLWLFPTTPAFYDDWNCSFTLLFPTMTVLYDGLFLMGYA